MPYNPKILSRARLALQDAHEHNVQEHEHRLQAVYRKIPQIEAIDASLRSQWLEYARLAMSKAPDHLARMDAIRKENLDLQVQRTELLVENGFSRDYLDEIVDCTICHDTGKTGSALCSCLVRRYNEELSRELHLLLRNGDESFENFNLSLYEDSYSDYFACNPREYMRKVCNYCKTYAENFPNVSYNLLLCGEPGQGKTYLSACIARVVANRGFTVYYDTAVSAFSSFERELFRRDYEDQEEASSRVRQILNCDLLILDDLGTEVSRPSATSALYTIINDRLTTQKFTVINTNLKPSDLSARYTPAIRSRLDGYYMTVNFAGSDIRQILRHKS